MPIRTPKLPPQVLEQASAWLIDFTEGEVDPNTRDEFNQWLRRSPEHVRAYLEISNLWEDARGFKAPFDLDALIARAREDTNVVPLADTVPGTAAFGATGTVPQKVPEAGDSRVSGLSPEATSVEGTSVADASAPVVYSTQRSMQTASAVTMPASEHSSFRLYATAIAATILIAIATGWFYLQRGLYATDIGEQRTIALDDGSIVELNSQSKIRIAYTDHQRNIQLLRGQALFKVSKDPNRPFTVDSDGTLVRAVGTQFDVYRKSVGTQVTVVEGRVAVAAPSLRVPGAGGSGLPGLSRAGSSENHSSASSSNARGANASATASSEHPTWQAQIGEVLVSAGEQILIAQTDPPELAAPAASKEPAGPRPQALVKPADIEAATAWTEQKLVFQDTPLREVVNEFNRYNRKPLVIHDPALNDYHVSGVFPSTDPARIVEFLRQRFGVTINDTGDEIEIRPEA